MKLELELELEMRWYNADAGYRGRVLLFIRHFLRAFFFSLFLSSSSVMNGWARKLHFKRAYSPRLNRSNTTSLETTAFL